jgi:hypothetical protein
VNKIDWMEIPLENFFSAIRTRTDGTTFQELSPFGDGEAQRLLVGLSDDVEEAYSRLMSEEDWERFETEGEVPLIREGRMTYKALAHLTLKDLPTILDSLVVLEEDHRRREREEAERKAAERKTRERVRAKERRKLKKLGEW